MTTLSEVIQRVRLRVADHRAPRDYEDTYYEKAVEFALAKLNYDFQTAYTDVPGIPINFVFLLIKLATIEMCQVRAAEYADSDRSGIGDISGVVVPDLEITKSTTASDSGPGFWLKLADKLQAEYDGELSNRDSENLPEVQVSHIRRVSLTTGGFASYRFDEGLSAVTILASKSGTTVTVAWDPIYSDVFSSYDVYRGLTSDMSDEELISSILDNHDCIYSDEALSIGDHYYRVKVVNMNDIESSSNIEKVTIV